MNNVLQCVTCTLVLLVTGDMLPVSCLFHNMTPYPIVVNIDMPFARDKEIEIPAGKSERYSTGFWPVRGYAIYALVNKLNEAKSQKVLAVDAQKMAFWSLVCTLCLQVPQADKDVARVAKNGLARPRFGNKGHFFTINGSPEYAQEVDLY